MRLPYELVLGWRYTRAGRATRRNGFISFISGVSMLGISLGVAALIIVLSVMNGFQKEVRDRMLGVVSHIEVFGPGEYREHHAFEDDSQLATFMERTEQQLTSSGFQPRGYNADRRAGEQPHVVDDRRRPSAA